MEIFCADQEPQPVLVVLMPSMLELTSYIFRLS